MRDLTCALFSQHLDETFVLHAESETFDLRLILAETTNASTVAGSPREPFSLVFRGAKEPVLMQASYRIDHPALGSHHIFIVPIAPDQEGQRYEAVFT